MTGASTAISLCADFSPYPDNARFPLSFDMAGLNFEQVPSSTQWFVNQLAGERGLRFPPSGGTIRMPNPVSTVELRVGTFASGLEIGAFDASGNLLARLTVLQTNSWSEHNIAAPGIATIAFSGGGSAAAIQRVCVSTEPAATSG